MRKRLAAGLLTALGVLAAPAVAAAGSFLDPDARVFTLQWRDGPLLDSPQGVGRLRALPDGSVLFVRVGSGANLWRLHLNGRAELLRWAGANNGLATEPGGTVLNVPARATTVQRLNLATRRRSTIADLAGAPGFGRTGFNLGASLAPFGDGSIAVSNGLTTWRIPRDRTVRRMPLGAPLTAMMPLTGGAIAALTDNARLLRVSADGARRQLATGVVTVGTGASGGLAVTLLDPAMRAQLAVIDPLGALTRLAIEPASTLGNGDGVSLHEAAWAPVRSLTVASDGSLLIATQDKRLRAVVPADSPRPRIAIAQSTYATFEAGRVGFLAGVPGALTLALRTHGLTVARFTGRATGGDGRLSFPPQPGNRYDVRLRLRTAAATTEARAILDTRSVLPIREGERSIVARQLAGGSLGGSGTAACRESAPRTVTCTILRFRTDQDPSGQFSHSELVPVGLGHAVLRRDGEILTDAEPLPSVPPAPSVQLTVPARLHSDAIPARLAASAAGRAKVSAFVHAPGEEPGFTIRAPAGPLDPGRGLDVELRPSRRQARTIRAWLARHSFVRARVFAELVTQTPYGPLTVTEARGTRLFP